MTIHIGNFSTLSPTVRTIIFVGTRSSDHLRELVRIAEFKGRLAYRVETPDELQPRWFLGVDEVGVVPGASDLQPILRGIIERLNRFSEIERQGMLGGVAQ